MVQQYPYPTIWVKNIVAIMHISVARAICILFVDHQDTESESREIEIGVAGPIFTEKNIKGSMGQTYPYSTRWKQNIVSILNIYEARAILLLFFYHQDTESESCEI